MVFVRIVVLLLWFAYSLGMGTEPGPLNGFGNFVAASFFVAAPTIYFLPTYEAWSHKHPNMTSIALVNLLLGWSLIGWVVALVWVHRKSELVALHEQAPVQIHETEPRELLPLEESLRADSNRRTKTCPYCAEQVLEAAIKCKHCGSDIRDHQ